MKALSLLPGIRHDSDFALGNRGLSLPWLAVETGDGPFDYVQMLLDSRGPLHQLSGIPACQVDSFSKLSPSRKKMLTSTLLPSQSAKAAE